MEKETPTFPYSVFQDTMNMLFSKQYNYKEKSKKSVQDIFNKSETQPPETQTPENQKPENQKPENQNRDREKDSTDFQYPSIFNFFKKQPMNETQPMNEKRQQLSEDFGENESSTATPEMLEKVREDEVINKVIEIDEKILKNTKMYYEFRRRKEYALQ